MSAVEELSQEQTLITIELMAPCSIQPLLLIRSLNNKFVYAIKEYNSTLYLNSGVGGLHVTHDLGICQCEKDKHFLILWNTDKISLNIEE
jgi:hypothetical protein